MRHLVVMVCICRLQGKKYTNMSAHLMQTSSTSLDTDASWRDTLRFPTDVIQARQDCKGSDCIIMMGL